MGQLGKWRLTSARGALVFLLFVPNDPNEPTHRTQLPANLLTRQIGPRVVQSVLMVLLLKVVHIIVMALLVRIRLYSLLTLLYAQKRSNRSVFSKYCLIKYNFILNWKDTTIVSVFQIFSQGPIFQPTVHKNEPAEYGETSKVCYSLLFACIAPNVTVLTKPRRRFPPP